MGVYNHMHNFYKKNDWMNKEFFWKLGSDHRSLCASIKQLYQENPNFKLVNSHSRAVISENSSAFIYSEGLSITNPDSHCAIGEIADHKYYFSPGRFMSGENDVCYQELCHITTKAYNNGGSIWRMPDNGTGCTAYVEGQYPYDPEMCDIYAMEMCMDGYDIDHDLGDAPSSSYAWDDLTCKCVAVTRRRSMQQVDARRKALAFAHASE